MYDGWLSFAGTEIINAERTRTYAAALVPTTRVTGYECDTLAVALLDSPYTTPAADAAPWYDPDVPASAGFCGFYPKSLDGFVDSTRTASSAESTSDGGFTYRTRRASRELRITGVLIGASHEATMAGLSWLKAVLDGSGCDGCEGDDLCFLIDCPGNATTEWERKFRQFRSVTCFYGPKVRNEWDLSCGGHMVEVEFYLRADVPWMYGATREVATAEGTTLTAVEPGATIVPISTIPPCTYVETVSPLIDPDCPPVPEPPTVPDISLGCSAEPASFFSYAALIPDSALQTWQDAVPTLTIRTGAQPVRHVRIRMLPRVPETAAVTDLDPCTGCASFVIDYIPPSSVAVIDGMVERVTMQQSNGPLQSAGHLVSGIGSEVFEWPSLSCGISYYMVVDVDSDSVIGLDLAVTNRE